MKKADLEKRIVFLEGMIRRYYRNNYQAKQQIGENPGIYCCSGELMGNEEYLSLAQLRIEDVKQIIRDLPLWDCGC